jgi:hypothetical protein
MANPFFTANEVAALRESVAPGLQTEVHIKKRRLLADDDASSVYGDDAEVWEDPLNDWDYTVMGWLWSSPSPVLTVVGGVTVLLNTYRLSVPVGTDIDSGDRVYLEGKQFIVSDTVAESTWLAVLRVSLRRVE